MFPTLPGCGTLRDFTQNISGVRGGERAEEEEEEEKWEEIEIGTRREKKHGKKMNRGRQNWTQQKRIGCNSKTWNMKYE